MFGEEKGKSKGDEEGESVCMMVNYVGTDTHVCRGVQINKLCSGHAFV